MNEFEVLCAVVVLIAMFLTVEVASAVLPIVVVITFVPPEQRPALAHLIATVDSSHKFRLWRALRLAVQARRGQR